eukprot:m.78736 g.78736  ORF g.78736 m.78736 type:complete len:254 (+) comp13254_c0_seq2:59-820(+)
MAEASCDGNCPCCEAGYQNEDFVFIATSKSSPFRLARLDNAHAGKLVEANVNMIRQKRKAAQISWLFRLSDVPRELQDPIYANVPAHMHCAIVFQSTVSTIIKAESIKGILTVKPLEKLEHFIDEGVFYLAGTYDPPDHTPYSKWNPTNLVTLSPQASNLPPHTSTEQLLWRPGMISPDLLSMFTLMARSLCVYVCEFVNVYINVNVSACTSLKHMIHNMSTPARPLSNPQLSCGWLSSLPPSSCGVCCNCPP